MNTVLAAAAAPGVAALAARASTSSNSNTGRKIVGNNTTPKTTTRLHHRARRVAVAASSSSSTGHENTTTSTSGAVPLTRRAAVGAAAAALLSLASPGQQAMAKPVTMISDAEASFGDSLLRRRQVEETAAQQNLNGIVREVREEEAKLKALRFEREAESMSQLNARRVEEEQKARQQVIDGKSLCITPFGIDLVGITETVALVGAVGAGLTSNARKAEIAELNEKLRTINVTLRQQIRSPGAMMVYPDGGTAANRSMSGGNIVGGGAGREMPNDSIDDVVHHEAGSAGAAADIRNGIAPDFESESVVELKQALREGRSLLKEGSKEGYAQAVVLFKKALMLSRMVGDQVQVRRAVRGLSASKRGIGDRKGAIADLLEVLEISKQIKNTDGDTDALGAIADIYTEIGDLESAGRYYDLYLDALNDELSTQMDSD
jgi:hypothetical protein